MSELLTTIFLCVALLALVVIVVLIFIHLNEIFEEPNIQKRMRKLRKPIQPWVTVLLYSRNNETDIDASLKAILKSHYHNFDIVVVNDYSRDAKKALNRGYRQSQKGKIVISLPAGVIVPPSFIKRAVAIKLDRKQITLGVGKPVAIGSLTEIVKSLNGLLWQHTYKVQVSDAKNIMKLKRSFHFDLLTTLFFMTIVSFSIIAKEPIILWYSWLIFTGYLLSTVWLKDEKVRTKAQLSFSAFSALFVLPVANIALSLSQFCSRN